ncbi:MAG TPA: GcrA family cell cycle regulator [Roseiarcus sp.]|jgi:hypothetical protein|nr:GcrA family cell cycle regulator [Roseiarcus sp.]
MYNVKPNAIALPIPEGGVAYTTYFADQEPIDGKLTVVDLTEGSCRWPTGNPRDLNTFRYCGAVAHSGPYCDRHAQLAYMPRVCREPPDAAALRPTLSRATPFARSSSAALCVLDL